MKAALDRINAVVVKGLFLLLFLQQWNMPFMVKAKVAA